MKTIHNWIALTAMLAVAFLGVLAIGQSTSQRVETQREAAVNLCLRNNEARLVANAAIVHLDDVRTVLQGALEIAENENGQRGKDARAYARFQATLSAHQEFTVLPILDCQKEVPRP